MHVDIYTFMYIIRDMSNTETTTNPTRGMIIDYTINGITTRYHVTNKRGDNIWVQTTDDYNQKRTRSFGINRRFWDNITEVK